MAVVSPERSETPLTLGKGPNRLDTATLCERQLGLEARDTMPECKWIVMHQFSVGVEVRNPVSAYADLGLFLSYEAGRLVQVEHHLQCDALSDSHQVVDSSNEHLRLFWELLRYWYGVPLPSRSMHVRKSEPLASPPDGSTSSINLSLSALISGPILLPRPEVLVSPSSRLHVWLRLAINASESDDVNAIRNYYMIWEDWHSKHTSRAISQEANSLRLIRDFVSHGEPLNRVKLLEFLKPLGEGTNQFDPTNSSHKRFVASQRESSRHLVERLIKAELQ